MTTARPEVPLKQWLRDESHRLNLHPDSVWYRLRRAKEKYYPKVTLRFVNQRVVFVTYENRMP